MNIQYSILNMEQLEGLLYFNDILIFCSIRWFFILNILRHPNILYRILMNVSIVYVFYHELKFDNTMMDNS